MRNFATSLRAKTMLIAVCLGTLAINPVIHPISARAAMTTSASMLTNGDFERGVPQSAWGERQSSGGELIDTIYPHSGSWAGDLCDIDTCNDGHGNPGDTLTQAFVAPGQVVSAQLTYSYSIATSEPNQNASCADWLSIGLGVGAVPDSSATKRYCASTGTQYRTDSIDIAPFLRGHGGQTVTTQLQGFTNALNPSEFFVDDVSVTVTYVLTPSAPLVSPIADCGAGQTTLSWSPPQFPLAGQWPVQSYVVTPYTVTGVPQQSFTVPGTQTSLQVSLNGGTVCYFTVTASNANGSGPAGSPAVPAAAVTAPSTPQSTSLTLTWTLQPNSAPATSYRVLIRDGIGPWLTWGSTSTTSSTVFGTPGHAYAYYVEAFGAAGGSPPSGNGQAAVTFPSSVARTMALKGLYGVDSFGNLHPADSPPQAQTAQWSWPIARGIVVSPSGVGGYVLDGMGGVHPFGSAPPVSVTAYWSGWDIARGIALRADGVSGYVLDGLGGVHPFGGAPAVQITAYWQGWDIARGIALRPDGSSGYVLDGWGGVHPFGGAPNVQKNAYWPGWDIARGITISSDGNSGYVLDGWGGVNPFGGAPRLTIQGYWAGWDIARGIAATPASDGGYVVDGFGGFHSFGSVASSPVTPNYSGSDVMRGEGGA